MSTSKSIPSHSGPPTSTKASSSTPSPTLYVTNLPEKLRKTDLRTALYMLFSTYGVVLDVVAMRGNKMRGQAHVVMRDSNASTQAMRSLQAFEFFGNEMRICYSTNKNGRSHVFNRLEGQWKESNSNESNNTVEKRTSAFEAPRTGVNGTKPEAEKTGPGLGGTTLPKEENQQEVQGTKRAREDEEEEASMDEESDNDVDMEQSDED